MLRSFLIPSALAAALICSACEKRPDQTAQQDPNAPSVAESTAAEASNEVQQAVGPNSEITPADMSAGMRVADVSDPQATLATAAVKSSKGEAIGEVRSVTVGPDGKASAVNVEVGGLLNVGERVVAIKGDKFTYLKDRNILVASVSKAEIEQMPAVKTN